MTARVIWPQALAEYADGQRRVEVLSGVPLAAVIAELATRYPALARRVVDETGALRRYVNVYVGGQECRRLQELATVVADGAEVHIIGSIAGG